MGHVLMDHRHGLAVDVELTEANGYAERAAALTMLDRHRPRRRRTVAGDKGYDVASFIEECRRRGVTPHIAINDGRTGSGTLDLRTVRHHGYRLSQRIRKRIEETFGWCKDGRPLRKMKVYGKAKVEYVTTLTVGLYTLLRVSKLQGTAAAAPA